MIWVLLCLAVELEPRSVEGITGRLRVEIAAEPEGPGLARVWLHLMFRGPEGYEVEAPRLEDPFAAWSNPLRISSWTEEGSQTLGVLLLQHKPGQAPLPDVTVRVRAGPERPWHTWRWTELLSRPKGVAPIEAMPATEPRSWAFPVAVVAIVVCGVVAGVWMWWRRAGVPVTELSAYEQARILLASGEPEAIEQALRLYVSRTCHVATEAMTRPELLAALGACPGELRERLDGLLRQCEECRFGGIGQGVEGEEAERWMRDFGEFAESGKISEFR